MIGARTRQPVRTRLTLALLLALTLVIPALGTPAPALAAPPIDRFGIDLWDMFVLGGFVAGPDGTLWFTQSDGTSESNIGRLNADGSLAAFVNVRDILVDMALGPDGNFWATARHGYDLRHKVHRILRITPQLDITRYELPTQESQPGNIVAGSDGALWFTEGPGNRIGRITTNGTITEYPIPTPASGPADIVAGPDGALWFAERDGNRIGRITTAGAITEFPTLAADSKPTHLTVGPDGRTWFSDTPHKRLGALATNGTLTFYALNVPPPRFGNPAYSGPGPLTAGPDGNLWVMIQQHNQIWRVTTSGAPTVIDLPFPDRGLDQITVGPDGRIWYAKTGRIGAITTGGQVKEWQYGALSPPAIYPAADGGIWLLTYRNFGQTGRLLARMRPNGFITWLDLSSLPEGARLHGATLGPDGALWCFVTTGTNGATTAFGHIADDGTITTIPLPPLGGTPGDLVFGPDGNRWFFLYGKELGPGPYNRLARLTPDGQLTTFPLQDASGGDYPLSAHDLFVGTDGNLWFVGPRNDAINRMTPGGQLTTFSMTTGNPRQFVSVGSLTNGPGGEVWFSGYIYDYDLVRSQPITGVFGKVTANGQVSFIPTTSPTLSGYSAIPYNPVLGPDGNIWFNLNDRAIFHKITPDGRISDYQVPGFFSSSPSIAFATPDSIWFAGGTSMGRFRLSATSTLATSTTGNGTVSPGGTYPTNEEISLTARPGVGSKFVGWRVDGSYRGWANPLPLMMDGPTTAEAIFAPTATFADLTGTSPTATAASELATRGIMAALPPARCQQLGLAAPCFGATIPLDRIEGAMMLAQSLPYGLQGPGPDGPGIGPRTWRDMSGPGSPYSPYDDRCDEPESCVPADEWQILGSMSYLGVTRGYGNRTFGPNDPLLNAQNIALISRAMVAKGYWQKQAAPPGLFAGSVPAVHADDVATYLHYVGSIPDAPTANAAWGGWLQPSTRGWYARALWAALDRYWGTAAP